MIEGNGQSMGIIRNKKRINITQAGRYGEGTLGICDSENEAIDLEQLINPS